MFGHIHIWQPLRGRCCKLRMQVFSKRSSLSFLFRVLSLLHISVYFPFHFILTLLCFFHTTSHLFLSPVPSIPRASSSQTRQTGFFGTSETHKHAHRCQRTLGHIPFYFNRGSLTQCLRVEQKKTDKNETDRKKIKNWRDVHSFGLPRVEVQKTCQ